MKENVVLAHINKLCDKKGYSKYRLAKESDISHSTLNNMFNRNNEPSLSTLNKICVGLGITMSEFFAEDEPETPKLNAKQLEIIQRYNNLPRQDKQLLEAYLLGLEKQSKNPNDNRLN
ncbi:MAG: helix-turn-helix transcriptional regulator [Oscillospiraceae bacterium]|nr:helix-turn-helix transcriptional regulator [Oscillospiraceae bacterium]